MNFPTWSDLNSPSIIPPLGSRRAPKLGTSGILISCEPDFRLIRNQINAPDSRSFFNSTLIPIENGDKGIAVVGPFIGAPYGAMLLESMIAQGVRRVLCLGWCGAVSDDFEVGDLVVPDSAIVDEGTSCNYLELDEDRPVSRPDARLTRDLVSHIESQGLNCRQDTIWTTDAIYRETEKKVSYFRNIGAKAVEMECSALFSVGQFRHVPVAALLVVSDSVASKDWDPGFRKKQFKTARQNAVRIVRSFMEETQIKNG